MRTNGRSVLSSRTLATLLAACVVGAPGIALGKDRVEEVFEKTYPMAHEGRISLGNVTGRVDIRAWDRDEVAVKAVRSAESREQLDAVTVQVEASADRLKVETKYPKGKWRWKRDTVRVDYTLRVPAGVALDEVSCVNGTVNVEGVQGRVTVSSVNGEVVAKGLVADAKATTVNGACDVSFAKLEGVKRVEVSSVNGPVTLTLPHDAAGRIDASSVNGSISTSFDLPVKKNWPIGRELKAALGEGGPKVKASTVNGPIRIERAAAR